MIKNLFAFTLFCFSFYGHSKNNPVLSFNAFQHDNEIIISWTIQAGNQCSDVELLHSTDSVNYTTIYVYPGICGTSPTNENYTYNHLTPKINAKNYYRLSIGNQGYLTPVIVVKYIQYNEDQYAIISSPYQSQMAFNNFDNKPYTFLLYNSKGSIVYALTNITGNEVNINKSMYGSGIYYFKLFKNEQSAIVGKMLF